MNTSCSTFNYSRCFQLCFVQWISSKHFTSTFVYLIFYTIYHKMFMIISPGILETSMFDDKQFDNILIGETCNARTNWTKKQIYSYHRFVIFAQIYLFLSLMMAKYSLVYKKIIVIYLFVFLKASLKNMRSSAPRQ